MNGGLVLKNRLKEIRAEKGLSQNALAEMVRRYFLFLKGGCTV